MTSPAKEIYVSVDIECDGPCPGMHSMLSIGAVALDAENGIGTEAIIGKFTANLDTLPGARPDPETMKWWSQNKAAYEKCRENTRKPEPVFKELATWLESLPGKPIFVGYPTGYDFTFVYWYMHHFAGRNPFARNALDIETYVMAILGVGYLEAGERKWPEHWFDRTLPHTHVALDDATEQGINFLRIMNDRRSRIWGAQLGEPKSCRVCEMVGGSLLDGPHTYSVGCSKRKFA